MLLVLNAGKDMEQSGFGNSSPTLSSSFMWTLIPSSAPILYPGPYPTESNIFLTYAVLSLPRKAPLLLTTNLWTSLVALFLVALFFSTFGAESSLWSSKPITPTSTSLTWPGLPRSQLLWLCHKGSWLPTVQQRLKMISSKLVWPVLLALVLPRFQLIFPSKTWFFGIYLNFQW